jgi:hypothetical protein
MDDLVSFRSSTDGTAAASLDWKRAHAELMMLAHRQATLDTEIGSWLLYARRARTHSWLGYASITEYARQLFGFTPRQTLERLRVAEALEELPLLDCAFTEGKLCWSAVRELTRVASPETESEWLAAAQGRGAHQVEEMVQGRTRGDRPGDPVKSSALRRVLRFELSTATYATVQEALTKIRRDAGSALSDDDALLLMARHVLGGPADDGRSSYQIAISMCPSCECAFQHARGELVELSPAAVDAARCDAQHIGDIGAESAGVGAQTAGVGAQTAGVGAQTAGVGAQTAGVGAQTAGVGAQTAGEGAQTSQGPRAASKLTHVGTFAERPNVATQPAQQQMSAAATMAMSATATANKSAAETDITNTTATGAPSTTATGTRSTSSPGANGTATRGRGNTAPSRATQSVPPRIRRSVLRRARHRCEVPGCRNSIFLDVHHLTLRSEGGTNEPNDLVTLCGAHHDAVHDGRLRIEGSAALGWTFLHADGTAYGTARAVQDIDASVKVFHALRSLGFRHGEARQALDALIQAMPTNTGTTMTTERLLREAVLLLTRGAQRHAPAS